MSEIHTPHMRLAMLLQRLGLVRGTTGHQITAIAEDAKELILANRKLRTATTEQVSSILAHLAVLLVPYGMVPDVAADGRSLVLVVGKECFAVPF